VLEIQKRTKNCASWNSWTELYVWCGTSRVDDGNLNCSCEESRTEVRGTFGLELCLQELCFGLDYIVFQKIDPEVKGPDSVKYYDQI
jgi:hypothetical protein